MSQESDNLPIEIDNFVSPYAATDVAPSDDRPLELDTLPAMVATEETPVVSTDVGAEPAEPANMLGVETSVVTGGVSGAFGSIRYDATPVVVPAGTIDANPTVVTHDGPDIFEARRLARGLDANAPMARPAHPITHVAPDATPADDSVILPMVAAAIETDEKQCGIELAWNPASREGFEIARATVCALLDSADLSAYHPPIPMPKGLFGVVFKQLNNAESRETNDDDTRLLARCVTRNDYERLGQVWPDNLVSRYVVGTIDASLDLGSLGSKDLVCSLVKVDGGFECQFSGGTPAMRRTITNRFAELQGESLLNVTSLLKWYRDTLERKFSAIRDGFAMLIVDNGTKDAKDRIATAEKLAQTLQGANPYEASPVMGRRLKIKRVVSRGGVTQREFYQAVGAGLLDAIREHGKVFATEYAAAQDAARKAESSRADATPASIEMAVRRAMIGSDRANSKAIGLLATLKALQARATAMVAVIGEHARPAILACDALRQEYAPKCKGIDESSERFANLELS